MDVAFSVPVIEGDVCPFEDGALRAAVRTLDVVAAYSCDAEGMEGWVGSAFPAGHGLRRNGFHCFFPFRLGMVRAHSGFSPLRYCFSSSSRAQAMARAGLQMRRRISSKARRQYAKGATSAQMLSVS